MRTNLEALEDSRDGWAEAAKAEKRASRASNILFLAGVSVTTVEIMSLLSGEVAGGIALTTAGADLGGGGKYLKVSEIKASAEANARVTDIQNQIDTTFAESSH